MSRFQMSQHNIAKGTSNPSDTCQYKIKEKTVKHVMADYVAAELARQSGSWLLS